MNLGRQMAGRRELAGSGPGGGAFFWTELGLLRLNFRLLTVAWKQTGFCRVIVGGSVGVKKKEHPTKDEEAAMLPIIQSLRYPSF